MHFSLYLMTMTVEHYGFCEPFLICWQYYFENICVQWTNNNQNVWAALSLLIDEGTTWCDIISTFILRRYFCQVNAAV